MCFFMLGHGVSALAASAIVGCHQITMREFFKWWIRIIATELKDLHIKFPSDAAELAEMVATYASENLPGCMGSVDCTHIGYAAARAAVRSWFIGKEGVPTVAFQTIVNHRCRIISLSPVYPGSHQDEQISRLDMAINVIRSGVLFLSFAFSLFVAPGRQETFLGAYLICDSGYQVCYIFKHV